MKSVVLAAEGFREVAQKLFEPFDSALKPRAYSADQTLADLQGLSVSQADFLRQGVRSVENSLFRGAIVISFCAVSDICADLAVSRAADIKSARQKWNFSTKDDLLEQYPDFQVFDALRDAKAIPKSLGKTLHSLLHRRNECAHPSAYSPTADEALGFIREAMRAVADIATRV